MYARHCRPRHGVYTCVAYACMCDVRNVWVMRTVDGSGSLHSPFRRIYTSYIQRTQTTRRHTNILIGTFVGCEMKWIKENGQNQANEVARWWRSSAEREEIGSTTTQKFRLFFVIPVEWLIWKVCDNACRPLDFYGIPYTSYTWIHILWVDGLWYTQILVRLPPIGGWWMKYYRSVVFAIYMHNFRAVAVTLSSHAPCACFARGDVMAQISFREIIRQT